MLTGALKQCTIGELSPWGVALVRFSQSIPTPLHTLLLGPICRACEEVLYGRGGVTLTTSKEVSCANELARYIVVDSHLHPINRDSPAMTNMAMGGVLDPTTTVSVVAGQREVWVGGA